MRLTQMPWALWRAQIIAILRLELKKTLFARRGLWIYFLAFAPAMMFAAHSFYKIKTGQSCDLGNDTHIFAAIFQFLLINLTDNS